MSSRWTGFFIWALVAASAAFWGVKIFAASRPVPEGAQAPMVAVAAAGPMERLFGAIVVPTTPVAAAHPESERFQLVGVIAPPNGSGMQDGLAIVTIDGQPARAWRIGTTLDGNTTLLAVARRTADFGPHGGPSAFTLQLPEPAAAETGTLTPAVSQTNGQPQAAQQQGENSQHLAQPVAPGIPRNPPLRMGTPVPGRAFNQQPGNVPAVGVPQGRAAPAPGQATVQQTDSEGRPVQQ
jgi:general secretion pathway protein C